MGWRWPAAGWPRPLGTGPGSGCCSSTAAPTTARGCSTATGSRDASRPTLPFLRPGRLPSALSTHVGFGYHWWPLDERGDRVSADGSRGQFVYLDRPRAVVVVKTSDWAFADPLHDRQRRDLSYLALPASPKPPSLS